MSRPSRKAFLVAEHAAMSAMLERLDEGQFIERMSLESRLEALREEMLQLEDVPEPATATLFFGGQPVVAQEAIEASFAADAVASFQGLVEKVGMALRGMQARDLRLHITGLARGSFGFEFTQLDEEVVNQGRVKSAITETSGLLEKLTADEAAFEEFMAEADPRVLRSLREFVKGLAKYGATLRFVSGSREVAVTEQQIFRANAWMGEAEPVVTETPIPGTFLGGLGESRRFEHRDVTGVLYKGYLSADVSEEDLARFAFKPCIAMIQTTTVTLPGRTPKKSYMLLSLNPLRDAGEQQPS